MPQMPNENNAESLTCDCACHDDTGGLRDFGSVEAPSVARTDPLAAALACDACRHAHAVALSGRPAELGPSRRPWNPPPLEAPAVAAEVDDAA